MEGYVILGLVALMAAVVVGSKRSRDDMEDTESIQVLIVDKQEAKRILAEEKVSIRAAYLLMQFIHADKDAPFAFLN